MKNSIFKCGDCNNEYEGRISTAEKNIIKWGLHLCQQCSRRRSGKEIANKQIKRLSENWKGPNNPNNNPEILKRNADRRRGMPLSEEHRRNLCKPKSKTDKIKEAANRPEEVERRRNRMLSNNPVNMPGVRDKISQSISSQYENGFYKSCDQGFISSNKTLMPIWCRSGLEKEFIEKCDKVYKIKSIESAEYLKLEYEFEGNKHRYLPDFKIVLVNGKVIIVEIKGSWFAKFPDFTVKTEALRRFSAEQGCGYAVLTEREIDSWLAQLTE